MALIVKELSFRTIEVTPGVGQIDIFRLSGQRQVPVLRDDDKIISNSSAIIHYLDSKFPEPKLIPKEPKEAAHAHLIENWADTTFANAARIALIKSASIDTELRTALLPDELPTLLREMVRGLPCDLLKGITDFITQGEGAALLASLEKLSNSTKLNKWLVGDSLTIADLAVSAQLSLLLFPFSSGIQLAGKGCKGFCDNPKLNDLFAWRDQLELDLMQSDPAII